jgi:hypothetical protein
MKLLNAFSLNMLNGFPVQLVVNEISLEEARAMAAGGIESAVGHADTAAIFGGQLGVEVLAARVTVSLVSGETVIVGQYSGPRLEEGAKTLPAGAAIKWLLVKVV